jgi:hypothetical protein
MEGGLGTWETLEGLFKMMAKGPDLFESWAGFQQRDVDPDEGCNFIISDGCVHFWELSEGAVGVETEALQKKL